MKANPKNAVPTLLLQMALDALSGPVATLLESGEDLAKHVWVYLDGRVRPGRSFAVSHLQTEGASLEQATRQVDAAIKNARARGGIFAFGVMVPVSGLLGLFRRMGAGAGMDMIATWAQEPIAPGTVRVAVIAGETTQLQVVGFGAAPSTDP